MLLNHAEESTATEISAAVRARTFEYFSRAHPGLIDSWNNLLDAGEPVERIAAHVRAAVVRAGRDEQQAAPFESALRHLVEKRKGAQS